MGNLPIPPNPKVSNIWRLVEKSGALIGEGWDSPPLQTEYRMQLQDRVLLF